jgi:aarF domain-containing kinase
LNENAPSWTSDAAGEKTAAASKNTEPIPRRETTEGTPDTKPKGGLEQDHHYDRSPKNAPIDPPPKGDLDIQQEEADRYPLPDGTIPPAELNKRATPINDEVISIRPQDEPHKKPIRGEGLKPASSGTSTIPLPAKQPLSSKSARVAQRDAEFQIPSKSADAYDDSVLTPRQEGHDEDTFNKRSTHTSPELSSLPRVKIPKHVSDTQGAGKSADGALNPDTFYNTGKAESAVEPEQEEIPEGVNTAVFHSSKIARSLGGRTQSGNIGLETPRGSSIPKSEVEQLAQEISQETDKVNKVRHTRSTRWDLY